MLSPVRARLLPWKFRILVVSCGFLLILLWKGFGRPAAEMQRFGCWGPAKSPVEITAHESALWNARFHTETIFNGGTPAEVDAKEIRIIDLNVAHSTNTASNINQRVLIVTPLRNASPYLDKHFELLSKLTYPRHLLDLAFLVSDSADDTLALLARRLDYIQNRPDSVPFNSALIVEKDFGVQFSMSVEERHKFEYQGKRRCTMGRARNYLLSASLKPEHSWVYWRDVDIVESPETIIEDFIAHDKDILVPNIWFHRYEDVDGGSRDVEGRFDYNSWQESEVALRLASTLDKDTVLAEGYKEYTTNRKYMAMMGDWRLDKDEEIELDGIGGVNILVKADVHRCGINFPGYAFENQAETEGFAKMAKRAGFQVIGLPNYVVWHIDTEEPDGNLR